MRHPSLPASSAGPFAVAVLLASLVLPAAAQDAFTINFRALGGALNPHPPIPQCQVTEMTVPPYPDSSGDCLHLLATSNGQPIECLEAGVEECPVLTMGTPSPHLFYATTEGLGLVDYDTTEPDACPLHCSPNWLLGENCGTIPGDPCFCDPNGCTGTPTLHGDWKDGLDFTHDLEPSDEEIRVRFGVDTVLSEIAFWRAAQAELVLQRSDCPAPLPIHYREAATGSNVGDGVFTAPFGGVYLPPTATLAFRNPAYRPGGTNDRIALQEMRVTLVELGDVEEFQRACPYFAVPFDRGFTDLTTAQWQRVDHDTVPATDLFTNTTEVSPTNCGLPNLAGGTAGGVCFVSRPGLAGFDTSLTSRAIDLSTARSPHLRFHVAMAVDDEILVVQTSIDGGASWQFQAMLASTQAAGTAIDLELAGLAYRPDVRLRLRYSDPAATDSPADHLVLDDILVYSDDGLFSDGFESGNTSRWITAT